MQQFQKLLVPLAVGLALTACGGSGDSIPDAPAPAKITAVKVFGDSLADSGTFGFRFTVQGAETQIYPERIAASFGTTLCNFYAFTGTTFTTNSKPGCGNYAIGGGVINQANGSDPRGIVLQMITASLSGPYKASDLALIDGGGNDAADLVGAYLKAPTDKAAAYAALLGTVLSASQVSTIMSGGAAGMATGGATYMEALADKFADGIQSYVLDKGAQQVVILNVPSITVTPRFQRVLDGIALASGGGTAGATARAQSEGLFKSWITAFNKRLDTRFAGQARVAVADFYSALNDQAANPAQYGLSNVKNTACPQTGTGADGLPTYTFPTCSSTALSASIPVGATGGANWWKTYAFSDGFHPTPYGHQLIAELIGRSLAAKGWK
ncbi:SGNH/GDSL hydrolase family protein [Roseateles sp.]|uniref:SGNH/GDSL hydrolase family protein n=1 Tax=Roseateles sp. TaxID=1971397 RepID=UPI003D0B4C02